MEVVLASRVVTESIAFLSTGLTASATQIAETNNEEASRNWVLVAAPGHAVPSVTSNSKRERKERSPILS
ncbi:hypothetical protein LMH87_005115 [Akanthomyces muscarius]|uniref:Uncharacterized protein n=1 Tax=Akanthomyces muscarius TaxID=2231603 RepID=A0A9W8QK28_AKAMU|nr:hypothetical protein LMH87_005115 [Akanthomyces muscarius]KAJ4163381.1 hypothetical protein LMH87_005115 [Akanthomyces muscarius]